MTKEEWLLPGAVVPVDPDTTKALVDEIKRLIGVVGGMALQARSAPVQEPVAIVDEDGVIVVCNYKYKPGDKFYTNPPAAQRQWVGLTDKDISDTATTHPMTWVNLNAVENRTLFARILEAKLKEKNGLHRQHVIDGSPCWCEPETSYTDPETGASVVVHKEPQ